mmetsp:Transcript_26746/g.58637  ORF Transcript_26746/g.58637 Transcript_26746/m.58637 type:complete len:106 (-) Transcript_26746:239-556(-)
MEKNAKCTGFRNSGTDTCSEIVRSVDTIQYNTTIITTRMITMTMTMTIEGQDAYTAAYCLLANCFANTVSNSECNATRRRQRFDSIRFDSIGKNNLLNTDDATQR